MPPKGRGKKKVDAAKNTASSNDDNNIATDKIPSKVDDGYVIIEDEIVSQSLAHIGDELKSLKSHIEENADRLDLIVDSMANAVSDVLKKADDSGDTTPIESKEETSDAQMTDEQTSDKTESEKSVPSKRGRKAKTKKEDTPISDTNKEVSDSNEKQNLALPKRGRSKNVPATNVEEMSANETPEEETKNVPEPGRSMRNRRAVKKDAAPPENATSTRGNKRKKVENGSGDLKKQNKSDPEILNERNKEVQVVLNRNHMIDQLALDAVSEKEEPAKPTKGRGKRVAKGFESEKPAKVTKTASTSSRTKKKEISEDVTDEDLDHQSNSSSGKKWNFKLSSWNVNGIRAWLEKDGLTFLQKESPDVMCVQETKCSDSKLPDNIRKVDGYHCYWLSGDKDGYSGVGLLSKTEPKSITYGINLEEHDNEGRVITAEYEHFYLVAAYVPNAGRQLVRLSYRLQWDKDFTNYLKKLDAIKPVVLCGDLNVAHEEIDLANPKTNKKNAGFTKEEREGFSNLLSEGFVDTFRHLYPDTKHAYTFWTYMLNSRAKNVGWRLDYFVISKRFVDNLCDSVICKDFLGSDHCPINLLLAV